jgi:hypothetical protein
VPSERTVYYQKLNNVNSSQYESMLTSNSSHRCNNNLKQIGDIPSNPHSHKSCNRASKIYAHHTMEDSGQLNNNNIYYPSSNSSKKSQKVAGYRIIRQIIPGPNSTAAEIEKALAR